MVFGLKAEATTTAKAGSTKEPSFDRSFNITSLSAQRVLDRICNGVLNRSKELSAVEGNCFMDDFRGYLRRKDIAYPVWPPSDIHRLLHKFVDWTGDSWKSYIGFDQHDHEVRWVRLQFTTGLQISMAASDALDWMERWENFIEEQNRAEEGKGAGTFFQSSALWVRAETERRLVTSTIPSAATSVGCALLVVTVSLRSLLLASYVIFSILMVVVCLMAFLFGVLGWPFGALEAVSLIIFVGSSVDYSLHMAESFSMSKFGRQRYLRLQDALSRTAGAILAAGVTTVLAAVPILFCTVRVFARFGAAFITNTCLSLFVSLGIFSGALAILGTGISCTKPVAEEPEPDVIGTPVPGYGQGNQPNACCVGVVTAIEDNPVSPNPAISEVVAVSPQSNAQGQGRGASVLGMPLRGGGSIFNKVDL